MVVAQAVDEEQVNVVGRKRLQPAVEHGQQILRGAGVVLGDQDDLLADIRILLKPPLEAGLGAIHPGGVERADPLGVRLADQPLEGTALAQGSGAHLEHRDLKAGLAEFPLGQDRRLGGGVLCRLHTGGRTQGRGGGQRTGLKERAAVGAAGLVVGHGSRLLDGKSSIRVCAP